MKVELEPTFEAFRERARRLIAERIPPDEVTFELSDRRNPELPLPDTEPEPEHDRPARKTQLRVPRRFAELAERVAVHREPRRFDHLYRVLWRLTYEHVNVLDDPLDPDVRALNLLDKQVQHDVHRAHAFVRFEKQGDSYLAYYRPDHDVLRLVVPHFVDRFTKGRYVIRTPDESVSWEGKNVTFGPGTNAGTETTTAKNEDAAPSLFATYYGSVHNPARLNLRKMGRDMPARFRANLPELADLAPLVAASTARTTKMLTSAHESSASRPFVPENAGLEDLREAAKRCTACTLYQHATQVVFGEGPRTAKLVIVGEQPGDREDLEGRPFVGPAGEVLNRALNEAGIARETVYLTNAVKHFKFTIASNASGPSDADGLAPLKKRRLHQRPDQGEIHACNAWLHAEITLLAPQVIVCAGATAGQAFYGPGFRLGRVRGQPQETPFARVLIPTHHPAAILRAPDQSQSDRMRQELAADLARAAESVDRTTVHSR